MIKNKSGGVFFKRLAIIFVLMFILMATACAKEDAYTNESSTDITEATTTKEPETTSPDIIEETSENYQT